MTRFLIHALVPGGIFLSQHLLEPAVAKKPEDEVVTWQGIECIRKPQFKRTRIWGTKSVEAIVQDDASMERVQRELIDFTAGTTPGDGCLAMT